MTRLFFRIETFRLLIAVTILTCQTDRQRADTINDWILLAIETKTALGNLYGFSAIMFGLCMPQVPRYFSFFINYLLFLQLVVLKYIFFTRWSV